MRITLVMDCSTDMQIVIVPLLKRSEVRSLFYKALWLGLRLHCET